MNLRQIFAAVVFLALATGAWSQELPKERPRDCDGSKCTGCTPFVPDPARPLDYPCGQVDIYFPVPVYVIRNDTSPGRELKARQWACFACCTLGCGFDEPQNTCAYTKYEYEENGKYGCTKCKGKDDNVEGGRVKLNFEDLSTSAVYSVINQPYGACVPADNAKSTPSPQATNPPPEAINPSPQATNPPPEAANPSPEAVNPSPEAVNPSPEAVNPSPPSTSVAPSPEEESPADTPETFVPVTIESTTTEETQPSHGDICTVTASAVLLVLAAMM